MDAVDILLLCVVGFSVLVFLIVDSHEESRKTCLEAEQSSVNNDSVSKTKTWLYVSESVKASEDQEEDKCVVPDGQAERQLVSENSERAVFQEIREEAAENSVDTSSERSGFCSGLMDVNENTKIDICRNMEVSERDDKGEEDTFDDWEGIERTELEKTFGEAVIFLSYKSNADQIDGDAKLQLYALQKVALEGPCHGSQPMALKVSARAKWNAWQKLGNMSQEMAMEKYVNILVKAIPGWKGEGTGAVKDARSSED